MPPVEHKLKKRYILVPVIILIITVAGFAALKTSEKKATTETTTTATASVDVAPAQPNINKALQPASKAFTDRMASSAPGSVSHFQLSLDVLKERENFKAQQQRWYAQMIFSGLMTLASIYVILSKRYPDEVNKWGYSTIAFVMGYWLKSL